jgi:hypothetical protein
VLVSARTDDPETKILFGDGQKFLVPAGTALVEEIDDVVYLGIPLRNVGAGLAVLQRYDLLTEYELQDPHQPVNEGVRERLNRHHRPIENFREQQRDIYIAPGDTGYWHAALRDGEDEVHAEVTRALGAGPQPISVDLLYGDHEGGQYTVSRFVALPTEEGRWLCNVVFHWTIESPDPRERLG